MDITNNISNSNTITSTTNTPKRVRLESEDWIDKTPRSRLLERWKEQDSYIDYLESRLHQLQQSIESNERLREKETECKKLKSMLNYRFLTKTTQQQSLDQMRDMMQTPSFSRLRQTYLDPSINLIYGQMRDEIEHSRKAREEAQNELHAWQFTPDSKTGKMLMARCKKLLEENEQLGKIVSSDNVAKLEGEISLQNQLLLNMKDAQKDYEDIVLDMDTNMDAMSSILLHMRQQLTDSHQQIALLNEENARLKSSCPSTIKTLNTPNGSNHTDSSSIASTMTNSNKLSQKRSHPSNRTTQNVATANKLKTPTNLYDVDETHSPPLVPLSSNETMDVESSILTSTSTNSSTITTTTTNNNNNNEHLKRTNTLENGINVAR
ncbi:unnamed protein product [Rotaria magnacalcarata]|uniref:Pre-mRNA-splicing regulator female-lethal(2)D n=1 Tax=Rotaria magnacalcarata TaxID=392030 RepID=A0A816V766_9BILA|nr:unnamed protein product [Rotaria magnacalcarata]CAF3896976.1 unnamed protein product [Rotaria magnacalcarata]